MKEVVFCDITIKVNTLGLRLKIILSMLIGGSVTVKMAQIRLNPDEIKKLGKD